MTPPEKSLRAVFYRAASGREPVRDWLRTELSQEARRRVGVDIATVEYGWPVGMPVCRPLGQALRELRTTLPGNRIARVLFCIREGRMILLHGFIKKSRKTPHTEIETALARLKELDRQ